MKRVLLPLLAACTGPTQPPDEALSWELSPLFEVEVEGIDAVDVVWRSELTDWIYLWSREDERLVGYDLVLRGDTTGYEGMIKGAVDVLTDVPGEEQVELLFIGMTGNVNRAHDHEHDHGE